MCTYGEWVAYNALEKGMKKGKKEGAKEATLRFIRNLMDSMGISAEEAMIKLQVPEKERSTCEALLKQS